MNYFPLIFKAAILERNNAPLMIDEVTFEGPLDVGQVLVKILYSGICGKQIEEITATRGADSFLPHMLGHEASGKVLAVGPGVTKVNPGNSVVLHWMKGSGIDAPTPQYKRNGLRINAGCVTTFNEFGVISENRLTPVPAGSNLRSASLLGCAASTGIGAAINEAALRPNSSIAVFGCGGVGLNVIQGAALVNAYPIIAVDNKPECMARAKEFGATHTVLVGDGDISEKIREITQETGAETVVITATSPNAIEAGANCSSTPGRVFVLGVPPQDSKITLEAFPIHIKRTISGAIGGGIDPDRDIPSYLNLYSRKKIKLDELITAEFSLEQINEGIDLFASNCNVGRIVINMQHETN